MVFGMAGCNGDDFSPDVNNMAGVYNLTKMTVVEGGVTGTIVSPDISGTINLTAVGTYELDVTIRGERFTGSGTYVISGDTIIIDGGDGSGPITDDGRVFSFTIIDGGHDGNFRVHSDLTRGHHHDQRVNAPLATAGAHSRSRPGRMLDNEIRSCVLHRSGRHMPRLRKTGQRVLLPRA